MNARTFLDLLRPMPPGAMVPVDWIREHLSELEPTAPADTDSLEDLDVAGVAALTKRAPSTIRGWLGSGAIPEAYRLRGRDWRVPRSALRRFLDRQGKEEQPAPATRGSRSSLSAWRQHIREAG
jgi:hypothetical protein